MDEIELDNYVKKFILEDVKNDYYNNELNQNITNQYGSIIKYKKIDERNYLLNLEILPFITNYHEKYYSFDKVNLIVEFIAETNHNLLSIVIHNAPKILEKNYHHPFIYPDSIEWGTGILAYQIEDWEKKSMLKFGEPLDIISQKKKSAEKLLSLIRSGQDLIEMKTKIDSMYSIQYLNKLNCLIANNKIDAVNYARSNDIGLERIFKNCIY